MTQLLSKVCGVTLVVLFLALPAFGQISTAQLSGKITDTSNAVLPGATVTVTQTDTGVMRSVVTEDRKSTRLNSSHVSESRMPSSA